MVPGKYLASAIDKTLITILKNKFDKKAERLMHMNFVVTEITMKSTLAHQPDILNTFIMCYNFSLLNIHCKEVFVLKE